MNNKIVSLTKKRISAIFLATILIAGTIALSFPSFMTISAAQAQQYYDEMDGYGSSDYKIDNDRKSYDNGYDKSQYPSSYKPDYKPAYPSYGKDDRDKSQKDIKNIDINKRKCINDNLNINGNNAGNVSIGNKGQVDAEEGYVGSYSSGDSGYGDKRYYDNGYNNNKKDKGFDCIINNNNTNIGGGGNQTIPPDDDDDDDRTTLTVTKNVICREDGGGAGLAPSIQQAGNIEDCDELESTIIPSDFTIQVTRPGPDPQPSSFPGQAPPGTQVQIGAGPYTVSEIPGVDVTQLLAINPNITLEETTFEGGCAPSGTGTIVAGVAETCNIINTFTIGEPKTTLTVIKNVVCAGGTGCSAFPPTITSASFTIKVDGAGGSTETKPGAPFPGTPYQLNAGLYTITEAPPAVPLFTLSTTFSGGAAGCVEDPQNQLKATGTITAGQDQTCTILNTYTPLPWPMGATTSITAQGTADSHELTAMDKITKLKTQWLNQLP